MSSENEKYDAGSGSVSSGGRLGKGDGSSDSMDSKQSDGSGADSKTGSSSDDYGSDSKSGGRDSDSSESSGGGSKSSGSGNDAGASDGNSSSSDKRDGLERAFRDWRDAGGFMGTQAERVHDSGGVSDEKSGGGPFSGKKDKKEKSFPNKLKSIAMKAMAAVHAALTALKAFIFLQLLAMLQALIAAVVAAVASIISTIISIITTVVVTVATVVGVSVAVAAVGVFGLFAAIVVAVVVVAVVVVNNNTAVKDDVVPCEEIDMDYMEVPEGIAPQAWTNAKLIYSFFKTYSKACVQEAGTEDAAITDEMIAAFLGNLEKESGIDTTSVEGIIGEEQFAIGPKKRFLWQGQITATKVYNRSGVLTGVQVDPAYKLGEEVINTVGFLWDEDEGHDWRMDDKYSVSQYDFPDEAETVTHYPISFKIDYLELFHNPYAAGWGDIEYLGIGLAGFTGANCKNLLDYADEVDGEWYDLSVQLMFFLDDAGNDFMTNVWDNTFHDESYTLTRGPNLNTYTNGMEYNGVPVEKAAEIAYHTEFVCAEWERPANYDSLADRVNYAMKWYNIITEWEEGVDYTLGTGSSLWDSLESAASMAYDATEVSDARACLDIVFMGNSSIAEAAVSFAWGPDKDDHNDGTLCWRHLFSTIFPGDKYFRSCDRTVAVAVRWSGADSDYPAGNVASQYDYLRDSDTDYRALLEAYGSDAPTMANDRAYWVKVDMSSASSADEFLELLQPGDILIRSDEKGAVQPGYSISGDEDDWVGHTLIYTGSEIIQRRFDDARDDFKIVSGSYQERSPSVGYWTTGGNNAGTLESYLVYRNVKQYVSEQGRAWVALTCAGHSNEE